MSSVPKRLRAVVAVALCAPAICGPGTSAQARSPQEALNSAVRLTLQVLDDAPGTISRVQRFEGTEVIDLREAESLLGTQKSTLLAGLSEGPELEALRAYIEVSFPEIEPAAIRQFDGGEGPVVHVETFQAVLGKARAFVEKLGRLEPLALNLVIQTTPAGARVTIRPFLGTRARDVRSNGEFRNVYRGLYVYTVDRPNHTSLSGELDLVDDPRSRLVCELVLETLVTEGSGGCVRMERDPAP